MIGRSPGGCLIADERSADRLERPARRGFPLSGVLSHKCIAAQRGWRGPLRALLGRRGLAWSGCLGLLFLGACASPVPAPVDEGGDRTRRLARAQVVSGDTLYAIAWRYGLDYRDLARWNELSEPFTLLAGDRLWLAPPPSGAVTVGARRRHAVAAESPADKTPPTRVVEATPAPAETPAEKTVAVVRKPAIPPAAPAPVPKKVSEGSAGPAPARKADASEGRLAARDDLIGWRWPARGKIVRHFRSGVPGRKGLDIAGLETTTVKAAAAGKVVYQGDGLVGYGRLVIIKHSDAMLSAYGYLGGTSVREGEWVKAGQDLGSMGRGGGYSGPVLHFEIRRQGKPVDPLGYLPG